MRIVGLTGGIATGKSTVGRLLEARGVPVIDADHVARAVLAPGAPALAALVEALGDDILDATGALDRPKMRQAISRDPSVKATLDSITHPAIRASIAQRLGALQAEGATIAVVEAALLVETGSYRLYPDLLVVTCSPETQLERLMARDDADEEGARAMIATQLPLAEKEAVATLVLRNDGTREQLERALDAAWAKLTDA